VVARADGYHGDTDARFAVPELHRYDILTPLGEVEWVGLDNYRRMFTSDPSFWHAVTVTLKFALIAVPLKLGAALAVALLLNRDRRGIGLFRGLFYLPSLLGGSVGLAIVWVNIFNRDGAFNAFLKLFGITGKPWVNDPHTALGTLMVLAIWQFGAPRVIFLAGLKQVPSELYEAASVDGAGRLRKFFHVTLPAALAGDLLQPGAPDHSRVPGLHGGFRAQQRNRGTCRLHPHVHPEPVHQGLDRLRDGLRVGHGVGLPDHHGPAHRRAVRHGAVLGPLLRRGRFVMAGHPAAASRRTTSGPPRRPVPRTSPAARSRAWVRLVSLIAILAIVLYPLGWMVGSSFKAPDEVLNNVNLLPNQFTPGNYPDGWHHLDVQFGQFFLNSALVAGLAVVGNSISCLLAAYAFARLRFRLRKLWFAIMIGTLLLPGHVLIIPQFILFRTFDWVGGPFPYTPLLVPHFLATDAFFVFLMVQFMRGIPRDLDQAAKMDGCSAFGVFWYVILPLSRPALITTAIFTFIWTWNDFFRQLVYLSDLKRYTVPVALTMFIDSTGQSSVGPMFAMAVLSLLPIFLFFVAFQRLLVEGINTAGLKG
jgi:multiple sugar transport system permease protein